MGRGKFLEAFMSGSDKPAPDESDSGDMADEEAAMDEGDDGGDEEGGPALFRSYRKALESGDDMKGYKALKRLIVYCQE